MANLQVDEWNCRQPRKLCVGGIQLRIAEQCQVLQFVQLACSLLQLAAFARGQVSSQDKAAVQAFIAAWLGTSTPQFARDPPNHRSAGVGIGNFLL